MSVPHTLGKQPHGTQQHPDNPGTRNPYCSPAQKLTKHPLFIIWQLVIHALHSVNCHASGTLHLSTLFLLQNSTAEPAYVGMIQKDTTTVCLPRLAFRPPVFRHIETTSTRHEYAREDQKHNHCYTGIPYKQTEQAVYVYGIPKGSCKVYKACGMLPKAPLNPKSPARHIICLRPHLYTNPQTAACGSISQSVVCKEQKTRKGHLRPSFFYKPCCSTQGA